MKKNLFAQKNIDLRVVLVRPLYERNVGATSRAMSNMGFDKLILIDPKCEFTIEANKAAASGQKAFENKIIYSSWEHFWQHEPDDSLRLSFTARDGRGRAARPVDDVLSWVVENSPLFQTKEHSEGNIVIHLFFGPEDWGLNADDIKDSHFCCTIPTYGENSSLNLAQAVLLALYTIRHSWGGVKTKLDGEQTARQDITSETTPSENGKIIFPEESLKLWLETMNIDISSKKTNAFTVLRRMLLQNTPTPKEWRILETVLQQSIRRMKK